MSDLALLYPVSPAWQIRNDQRIGALRTDLRPIAREHVRLCWRRGLPVVLMPPVRTDAQQRKLYAQGRTTPGGIVTWARTSDETPHGERFRAAYDLAFLVEGVLVSPKPGEDNDSWDGDWLQVGTLGESVGLAWGGRWKKPKGDRPHFELPGWKALPHCG